MNLDEYQRWVKLTTYGDMHGVELLIMSNALGGECGELQNEVKKFYRDGGNRTEQMSSELGDIIWYVAALCNTLDISLVDVINDNVKKIDGRQGR